MLLGQPVYSVEHKPDRDNANSNATFEAANGNIQFLQALFAC